ncbi:MAG: hypothetical protein FWF88_12410 [Peptococcaceae bacterium]|nr:hypothetical protein [Peptococcaceae bacterium]
MKRTAKLLVTLVCMFTLMVPGVLHARQIQNLTSFKLPAYQGIARTSFLTKSTTNANWVMNITALTNATTVHTVLQNSNYENRSDYAIVGPGRYEIRSTGQANYLYCALLMNGKSTSSVGYVTGSWSPDNK